MFHQIYFRSKEKWYKQEKSFTHLLFFYVHTFLMTIVFYYLTEKVVFTFTRKFSWNDRSNNHEQILISWISSKVKHFQIIQKFVLNTFYRHGNFWNFLEFFEKYVTCMNVSYNLFGSKDTILSISFDCKSQRNGISIGRVISSASNMLYRVIASMNSTRSGLGMIYIKTKIYLRTKTLKSPSSKNLLGHNWISNHFNFINLEGTGFELYLQ